MNDADVHPLNRLAQETSPYLRQHMHNPVDWYPWGEEAFRAAREQDRPILLSVGYSTCHWCHVMAHESFENAETAEYMNRHFVNIKLDREERPDIDGLYMSAVQAMNGSGGWPMTVFLTPDLRPFYAGTYFPPRDMQGIPSFARVMASVASAWKDDRDKLENNAEALTAHIREASAAPEGEQDWPDDLLGRAVSNLEGLHDRVNGGFGPPRYVPARSCASVKETPEARTRTRTSSGPGRGGSVSTTWSTSGPPKRSIKTRFMRPLYARIFLLPSTSGRSTGAVTGNS